MENTNPTIAEDLGTPQTEVQNEPATQTAPDNSDAAAQIRNWKQGKSVEPASEPATPQTTETPTEPKTEPATEAKPTEQNTGTQTEPAQTFKAEDFLKLHTNGAIESPEQLASILEEHKALKENPIAALSEVEQQAVLAIRNGVNPMEYLAELQKDYTSMDAIDVLKEQFLKDNPDLDKELAEYQFNRVLSDKYKNLDLDDPNDPEYKLDKALMEREANKVRAELEKAKEEKKFKLPEPVQNQVEVDEFNTTEYLQSVEQAVAGLENMKIQMISDGSEITFGIDGKEEIAEGLKNPIGTFDSRWTKDGKWNLNQFGQDLYVLKNLPKILDTAYLAGKESGTKNFIDTELKNTSALASTASHTEGNGANQAVSEIRRWKTNISPKI